MRFWKKTKGAVSVFLVIILVPVLTVSSVFVDASKIQLAKAVAESAGALTMNTALTNYDTQLKELYGLMATAQDTSDLFAKLEDYYKTCITSSGVSEEDAETYVEQIMAQLGLVSESDDTADIMNMQVVDFTAEKYPEGNLANATVLKKQLVDFMKYRAPINTGLSFVNSLQSFSTLSKQTELVEKKQEYYEAQQTVLENLKAAWEQIASYNGTKVGSNGTNYLSTIESNLKLFAEGNSGTSYYGYKQLHQWMVMDLYKVADYIDYSCGVGNREYEEYTDINGNKQTVDSIYTFTLNGTVYDTFSKYCNDYSMSNLPTADTIKTAITNFYSSLHSAEAYEADLNLTKESGDYELQLLVQAQRKGLGNYTSQEAKVYTYYQKLQAMMIWVEAYANAGKKDEDGNAITTDTIKNTKVKITGQGEYTIQEWYNKIDTAYSSEMTKFGTYAELFTTCSNNASGIYTNRSTIATTEVNDIATKINEYVTELTNAKTCLENAITNLDAAKTQLTGNVATAKTAWSNVASDSTISSTSLAQQDQAEIAQLDTYLNEENITKLVTRLSNVRGKLETTINQIKGYKYGGTFIGEITDITKMETAIASKCGDSNLKTVPVNQTQLQNTASSWWGSCWTSGGYSDDWVKQSGYQPNLNENKVALYTYLSTNFAGTSVDSTVSSTNTEPADTENGENFYKNIKSTSESTANSKTSGTDSGQTGTDLSEKTISGDNLPSKQTTSTGGKNTPSGKVNTSIDGTDSSKSATSSSASALGNLFSKEFLSSIASMAEDLRDNLYVADYIMSMFSYDTIEKEYLVEHKDENVTEIKDGMLLSLTKNDISASKNYVYGAEVEYITYGGSNSSNLTKAYGTIYGIRFGFNLVYAFATSEIRDSAFAIATPISAATLGVIPVPLIQAVIIIAIACCESAIDLYDLKNGESIPLYKSSKTWNCSVTGLTNYAKAKVGTIIKETSGALIDEGVNQLNNLLDMSEEELTKEIEKSADSIADTVTSAYDQIITENAEVAIQQLTTLINTAVQNSMFLEAGQTYEAKKAEMKQWVKTNIQEWGNQQSGSDIASMVKREAVNLIVNNSDQFIDGLFDVVEQNIQSSASGSDIEAILSGATTNAAGTAIDELGGEIMDYVKVIRQKISAMIKNGSGEVSKFIGEQVEKVKASVEEGAESLKTTLNSQINSIFGTETGDGSTGVASLCSFSYSDYLRLFVLIGLYINEEKIILRTADVIQTNMAKCITNNGSYVLSSAAAYVRITAEIQVKPTLLALPIFASVKKNPIDNTNWYTVTYGGISGY